MRPHKRSDAELNPTKVVCNVQRGPERSEGSLITPFHPPKSVFPLLAVVFAGVCNPCGLVKIVWLAPYAMAARFR
jgi:hypothetical protein